MTTAIRRPSVLVRPTVSLFLNSRGHSHDSLKCDPGRAGDILVPRALLDPGHKKLIYQIVVEWSSSPSQCVIRCTV